MSGELTVPLVNRRIEVGIGEEKRISDLRVLRRRRHVQVQSLEVAIEEALAALLAGRCEAHEAQRGTQGRGIIRGCEQFELCVIESGEYGDGTS